MTSGLLALLDDVAALVKVTAVSIDDIPAQVAKTTGKVSGIVIDDAAVTPKYVVGLSPSRELAIIYAIAKSSLINKLLFLSPAALLLGIFAPWLIQPLLMLGGSYLCFEGYEKVHSIFAKHEHIEDDKLETITPEELEKTRIKGAVKTDFILSAEIIAITYATVADKDLITKIIVLLSIAIIITIAVYGFVGLIVKADDFGLHLAKKGKSEAIKKLGAGIVKAMPNFLKIISYIGTAAMLWVGAEIVIHGIPFLHHILEDIAASFQEMAFVAWFAKAVSCAIFGIILGVAIEKLVSLVKKIKPISQG